MGIDSGVNYSSGAYIGGSIAGMLLDVTRMGAARAAGMGLRGLGRGLARGLAREAAEYVAAEATNYAIDQLNQLINGNSHCSVSVGGGGGGLPPWVKNAANIGRQILTKGRGPRHNAVSRAPNPFGKAGKPPHQSKVAQVEQDIKDRGFRSKSEHFTRIPAGGHKSVRYADAVAIDPRTKKVVEVHQVGRRNRRGDPVARERRAMEDLQLRYPHLPVIFHPYN